MKTKSIKTFSLLELQNHKKDLKDTLKFVKKNKWTQEMEAVNGISKKDFETNTRHTIAIINEALEVVNKLILEKMKK